MSFVNLCNTSEDLSPFADKLDMKRPLTCLLFLLANQAFAEYFSVSSGYSDISHDYLLDSATLEEQSYRVQIDLQTYRRRPIGWLARGPKLTIHQSANTLNIDSHFSLYQFHVHQGLWFQFEWVRNTLETQISSNQVYLDDSGSATAINTGDTVILERNFMRGQVYWYESVKDEGPINHVGLYYSLTTSPVNSTISTTNASLFDGRFSGFGFSLGRIKDDKGFNFQWQLSLAQLDTDFSNDVTSHQQLSSLESTVYKIGLRLDWHYRYYMSPYWYLTPSLHVYRESLLQSQLDPEFVEHKQFSFTQLSVFLAIRRYF